MKVWSNAIRSLLLWTWMCEPKCPCRCEHQRAHQPSCKHQQNLFFRYCHSGANTGAFFVSIKNKVSKVNNLLCSHFLPFTPLYFWGGFGQQYQTDQKKEGKKVFFIFFFLTQNLHQQQQHKDVAHGMIWMGGDRTLWQSLFSTPRWIWIDAWNVLSLSMCVCLCVS